MTHAALTPGPEIPETLEPGRAQGTGLADGVIYLNGRINVHTGETLLKSRFREALRYLRPQTVEWLALNPGSRGRCKPDCTKILSLPHNQAVYDAMLKLCQETGQTTEWSFTTGPRTIDAVQPEHLHHWHVLKAAEGIWVVIYV